MTARTADAPPQKPSAGEPAERPRMTTPVRLEDSDYGSVLFGGAASLNEECLMGPDVNYLFRMEKVAGALGVPIMCSGAARAKLETQMQCERVGGDHELKGFEGQHRFYGVRSVGR